MTTRLKQFLQYERNILKHDGKPITALPDYEPFVDITGSDANGSYTTRLYFAEPSKEELLKLPSHINHLRGTGRNTQTSYEGIEEFISNRMCSEFAREVCQLLKLYLSHKSLLPSSIEAFPCAIKHLIRDLCSRTESSLYKSIMDIQYEDWILFADNLSISKLSDIKTVFLRAISPFLAYCPTNFDNSLYDVATPQKNRVMAEHTSMFFGFEKSYSDSTMYQLLAHFIFHFYKGIDYLKRYSALSPETMPENWIFPGRKSERVVGDNKRDNFFRLKSWLTDERGYQIILDHKLLYHKLGHRGNKSFHELMLRTVRGTDQQEALKKYQQWEKKHHYLFCDRYSIGSLYSRDTSDVRGENNLVFCLANIVMIYTGLNKEVVMSWPSKSHEKSILENFDTLFLSGQDKPTEIIIPGIKNRTGARTQKKIIRCVINIHSPLYKMLKLYEEHAKNNNDGPFFEITKSKIQAWTPWDFTFKYPTYLEGGELLNSIDTKKFRKVFAGSKLLEQLAGTKSANEIAEKIRNALSHKSFDTTMYYLLRSETSKDVMDVAIVSLTDEKLRQSTRFQGEVNFSNGERKKLYLCECSDPNNPTHDLPIAEECTYYDNCLGCERSVISSLHLPNICYRILQYEAAREKLGSSWSLVYEAKWLIAHDALEKFKQSYPDVGESLVKTAWVKALNGEVTLPPIFSKS